MQSPGWAPTWAARPARSSVGQVLRDRSAELAVLLDQHVGEALGPALLGPLLPGVELLARLGGAAGHHHRADVLRLEHPERGVGEEVGALDELLAHPEVGLVGAEPAHRLGVGHPRHRPRHLDPDQLPHLGEHVLHQGDHVVLLDEAHLDVELGELGLPVGAEVLVAVAARDLVVALHAGHHQQLLEQLRALREGVPAARVEACRYDEVARTLGRGAGQRRGLDLDEVVPVEHVAGRLVDLAAQPERGSRAGAAQVEVAVLEPRLLTDLDVLVDRERQRRRGTQHHDVGGDDLDVAGREVGVLVAGLAGDDLAGDLEAELAAEAVGHGLVTHHDLDDAAGLAQIQERHSPVVATAGDPTGEGDGLSDVRGTQRAGVVGADHCCSLVMV